VLAQGVTAIVSEYAPGGDLFDYLFAPVHTGRPRPFAFPEPLARHIGRQLIDGVLYLHGHEIYHRDLKVSISPNAPRHWARSRKFTDVCAYGALSPRMWCSTRATTPRLPTSA
jgi:serine/threonine protein kinase